RPAPRGQREHRLWLGDKLGAESWRLRVLGHRRRESATFEPHVRRRAKADAPARVMALDDCDLDEVTAWIGSDTAVPDRWLYDLNAGDQLRRDDAHDSNPLWSDRDSKRSCVDGSDGDGLPHPFGNVEVHEMRRRAALEHPARTEGLEIVEDQDVGLVTGRDRAEPPQAVIGRRVD